MKTRIASAVLAAFAAGLCASAFALKHAPVGPTWAAPTAQSVSSCGA